MTSGAVEVPALGFDPVDQALGGFEEGGHVHPDVVVVGDEGGGGAEVVENGDSTTPLDAGHLLLDGGFLVRRQVFAEGRRHAGHARAAESVENQIAGFRVVEDVPQDRLVGNLRVVAVGHVDRVVLARSHVEGKRLAVIRLLGVVGLAVTGNQVPEERIRAGGEMGRVGEGQDVLDLAHGEPVDLSKVRIEQMLAKTIKEMRPA